MSITSFNYAIFIALAWVVYNLLPGRLRNIWLLFVSYAFVLTWDWKLAILLGIVTTTNFLIAPRLRVDSQGRRSLLWLGVAFNVSTLVLFRAANFFLLELEEVLEGMGVTTQAGGLHILIPLGLSYYTLQAISYLVDVYRGQAKSETDFINFSLYLAYFPKMIAGPIERARSFLPKLSQPRPMDYSMISQSILLIFLGLARKLLLADTLTAFFLSDVFEIPGKYTSPELFLWLVTYAFALYNDFAGYTLIVRGVSGFFGIELSPNFRAPYFSRNFTEFWNRWHITLSEWLRDYIYFPVSRALSRRNPSRRDLANLIFPPMLTMLASGLWHGFGMHMLLWGALHGFYLIFERIPSLWRPSVFPQNQPAWRQGLAMGTVFLLVILAWVPFRWGLPVAFDFWSALFDWSSFGIHYRRLFIVLPILLVSLGMDYMQNQSPDEFVYLKWPRLARAACMAVILLLVFIATGGDFKEPFVYQAF